MGLCVDLKSEFQVWKQKLSFQNGHPNSFYKCKWWDVSVPLLVYRAAAALYTFILLVVQLNMAFKAGSGLVVMTAFTIWSYIIVTCYFVTASISSALHTYYDYTSTTLWQLDSSDNRDSMASTTQVDTEVDRQIPNSTEEIVIRSRTPGMRQQLPFYMMIQWCLYNLALPSSILVTLIYWSVLYPMILSTSSFKTNFVDISVHGLNSVFMITEQYLGSVPTRLLHVYQPVVYGIIYMIMSLIVWSQTGLVLYPYVLDWGNPITAASLCGIVLYYILAQLILYIIYWAQNVCISRRIN